MVDLRRASLDSVNLDRPDIAYDVISGAPSGPYIFLAPIVTLRTMDERSPGRWVSVMDVTVDIEGEDKPALAAEWLGMQIVG